MLAYRAFWQETRADAHDDVLDTFRAWAATQQTDAGSGGLSDHLSQLRIGTHPDAGRGGDQVFSEATLLVESASERAETTLRVVSNSAGNWLWVDVLTTDDADHSKAAEAAPELVARLIERATDAGRKPCVGKTRLKVKSFGLINPDTFTADIDNVIRNAERLLPVVVVAHDYYGPADDQPKRTIERADAVARQLAGVASVAVVPKALMISFQNEMGPELAVNASEVRVYMPGSQDDANDRRLSAEWARRAHEESAHWCLSTLRRWLIARQLPVRAPRIFEHAVPVSPADVETSAEPHPADDAAITEELQQSKEDHETTFRALRQARAQLKKLRTELDEQARQVADYEEWVSEVERERDNARRDAASQQQFHENALARLSEKSEQVETLQDQLVSYLVNPTQTPVGLGQRRSMQAARSFRVGSNVTGIADALSEFDEFWHNIEAKPLVVVPDSVRKTVARLDRSMSREADGRKVLDALGALAFYALEVNEKTPGRGNDFWDWCEHTAHPRRWPASGRKLAMSESEEVMRRPEFMKLREFPIDPAVSLTGRNKSDREGFAHMWAHMKLTHGGGALRLHFYDDTRGKTKKVHVGYIGPHLATKRFN